MDQFLPKAFTEDHWIGLEPNKGFAVKCLESESLLLRFGSGVGLYLRLTRTKAGGVNAQFVEYESGDLSDPDPLPTNMKVCVGRTEECQFKIQHVMISRRHMEMKFSGDLFLLKDRGSTNGTFLFKELPYFDIDSYLAAHPVKEGETQTLDPIHEQFGATLDDFLIQYQKET